MFIDACAIVSIFVGEPDAGSYEAALTSSASPFTSTLAAWEAILVLCTPGQIERLLCRLRGRRLQMA